MTQRRHIIVANWKANLPPGEEVALAGEIGTGLADQFAAAAPHLVEVLLAPSIVGLVAVTSLLRREHPAIRIGIAAQDASATEVGAHTGESPATHLVGIADAVIVGHSERRRERGESDAIVGAKLARIVAAGLRPILCLGDDQIDGNERERAAALKDQWIAARAGAAGLGVDRAALLAAGLVVAYEPVWAIGSGRPATPAIASAAAAAIRASVGSDLPILYGGSVDADGAAAFLASRHDDDGRIDGLLVGGASLSASRFLGIIAAARSATNGR
ncbi:MAG: triose-phosphate isomerase [Candidatus Limnocylindrus sp.]